jgi:hypothetical protein
MSNVDRNLQFGNKEDKQSNDRRAPWERPALRRLAANLAEGGGNPGNDGQGKGGGSNAQHS